MPVPATQPLSSLYHEDETAWLELMVQLIAERRYDELDYDHLREFLDDMARRDKREVLNRLIVLLVHLLKWDYTPARRTRSWQSTILVQRRELADLVESGTLRRYATEVLDQAYVKAIKQAMVETGASASTFPATTPWRIEQILSDD